MSANNSKPGGLTTNGGDLYASYIVTSNTDGPVQVQVSAKKNKGGGLTTVGGHLVKLDPVVLAMMDKRVAQAVALEKAKLMEQFKNYSAGGQGGGDKLNEEQRQELKRLQAKVKELEEQQAHVHEVCRSAVFLAFDRIVSIRLRFTESLKFLDPTSCCILRCRDDAALCLLAWSVGEPPVQVRCHCVRLLNTTEHQMFRITVH